MVDTLSYVLTVNGFQNVKMGNVVSKTLWNFYVTKDQDDDLGDDDENNVPATNGEEASSTDLGRAGVTAGVDAVTGAPSVFTNLDVQVSCILKTWFIYSS